MPTFAEQEQRNTETAMTDIRQYLDSTYLETPATAGITPEEYREKARKYIQEAIDEHFKLIMIRPDQVAVAGE